MFKSEGPILTSSEDILGRTSFACKLADAISQWKSTDSLVVGLYGKWGCGKSSVINLAKEHLSKLADCEKPTVIEFNPWMVSGQQQLLLHFFDQVAAELELQNREASDKATALKLRKYAALLLAVPGKSELQTVLHPLLMAGGLIGLAAGFTSAAFSSLTLGLPLFVIGLLLTIIQMPGNLLNRIAEYFDARAKEAKKTIASQKQEIVHALVARKGILLIIIDDVDRLTESEVKQLVGLVKINSDFPNTVYLMAFDRMIIEQYLSGPTKEIDGRKFLEKIVQVNFEIPQTRKSRVQKYLFQELDAALSRLPKGWDKYFELTRWRNLYHSGFKDFFDTIRDIKRYANSLSFNLTTVTREGVLEANPIDFMAIECIRVFCPEFYDFMRRNRDLFTYVDSDFGSAYGHGEKEERSKLLNAGLNKVPEAVRTSIQSIVKWTFPGVLDNINYGSEFFSEWNKKLQARSPEFFDVYFSLVPGGDEEAFTQFDVNQLLSATADAVRFEELLKSHIERGTIRNVLERLQDFTSGDESIPDEHIGTVAMCLFHISDMLPQEKKSMFDAGAWMDIMRILYQLGKRVHDPTKFKSMILPAIIGSKSLWGPIEFVSLETPRKDSKKEYYTIANDAIHELQAACIDKIREFDGSGLLYGHANLRPILYRWKEWATDKGWQEFVEVHTTSDEGFLDFLSKFVYDQESQTFGEYAVRKEREFGFQNLAGLLDLRQTDARVRKISNSNKELVEKYSETIRLFLKGIDQALRSIEKKVEVATPNPEGHKHDRAGNDTAEP